MRGSPASWNDSDAQCPAQHLAGDAVPKIDESASRLRMAPGASGDLDLPISVRTARQAPFEQSMAEKLLNFADLPSITGPG